MQPDRIAAWIVRAASRLVPALARTEWLAQWTADLDYHRRWLAGTGLPPAAAARDLRRRALGAFRHAAWLRRRHWSTSMILQDLKYAVRSLVRRPSFSGLIVIMLAVGIGANATIFSWIDALVYGALPGVADESSLVVLHQTTATRRDLSFSYPNFRDLSALRPDGFSGFVAFSNAPLGMRIGNAEPERAWAEIVSGSYFDVLGVRARLGRLIEPRDAAVPGEGAVAVLSDRLWQTRFGARTDVIGSTVGINGQPFTVIGVASQPFKGAMNGLAADLWAPMSMQTTIVPGHAWLDERSDGWLQVIARRAPGTPRDRAEASLAVTAGQLAAAYPVNQGRGLAMIPLGSSGAGHLLVPVVSVVMGVVAVVLLIACANIAGLMLMRNVARRREMALRLALGASRWQLARQLLVESAALAAAGGAAGVAIAAASQGLLVRLLPPLPYPVSIPTGVNGHVLVIAAAASGLAVLVFGLAPALQASKADLVPGLKDTGSGAPRSRLRQALVVGQVALALVLLVLAGLFARAFAHADEIDPGFGERRAVLASIDLSAAGYDEARGQALYRALLDRLDAAPGARAASLATIVPLSIGSRSDTEPTIEGYQPAPHEEITVYFGRVAPHYFEALRLPIVAGRAIDERDISSSPRVVVINEAMAQRYWKGRNPVGGRVDYGDGWATVVGVARTGKYYSLGEEPKSFMYLPILQVYQSTPTLIVATSADPDAVVPDVRRVIHALDPNLPLFEVRTLGEQLRASRFVPRLALTLLGVFGALALFLAVVGLYGVIAYSVARRTREIGVRMALGAERRTIQRQVLGEGVRLTLVGLVLGLGLAVLVAPALASQLMGVPPLDVPTFVLTAALLLLVAALAAWRPASRASRVDPIAALRMD